MSTSKGKGLGFADSVDIAPAQIWRFLLVRTRPNAVIDFDTDTNDLILLYERYDRTERVYYGKEDLGEKENKKQKRIYELSYIGKIPKRMPPQVPFTHAAVLVQIFENEQDILENLKETGHLYQDASKEELSYVKERLKFAGKWVDNFAPEQYKFELQTKVNVKLDNLQKKALHMIAARLKKGKWSEQQLYNEFYKIRDELEIAPKDLFRAAYLVLLNKEKGPKLAPFLLAVKDKAIKLFEVV